jgi:phage shock protein A
VWSVLSIFKRVRTILASNINARIINTKDPEVEINKYVRELERDFREIKGETESTIALMSRVKRELNECQSEMNKMERYAMKALDAGDEDKARRFIEEKVNLKPKLQGYKEQYTLAQVKVEQMKLAQDKLSMDLQELSTKRDEIVGKLAAAESKKLASEIGASQSNVCLSLFDQLEEKANRALAEAEALEELRKGLDGDIDRLVPQYDKSIDIENELAELKGKNNN